MGVVLGILNSENDRFSSGFISNITIGVHFQSDV